MKKLLLLSFISFIFVGCGIRARQGEDLHYPNAIELQEVRNKITYIRDSKTDLCFAVLAYDTEGFRTSFSISYLPCNVVPKGEIK